MKLPIQALALALLASLACGKSAPPPPPDPYAYVAPPAAAPPAGLDAATWQTHLVNDLAPYWAMPEALGTPLGNFPTWRGMDGSVQQTARKPRMMGRQTYAYSVEYLITGDETKLQAAKAGSDYLLAHAVDTARGGWYSDLDANGNPAPDGDKLSQDMAYDILGPAAYFYVSRDAAAESAILATRDLMFDPARLWDAANGRIKDGMNAALTAEAYMNPGGPGSWQLVAQLDPVTAFLLLAQPALSDAARRTQLLADLRTLALRIHDSFWKDGFFFGSTGDLGNYGSNHSDYGHILKSYWALLQIDKRLSDHPLKAFLDQYAAATLKHAYDDGNGLWVKAPTSKTGNSYGSDWWAYAEADQLGATLAMRDAATWLPVLSLTGPNFIHDYVDGRRPARELVSSISWDGRWVYGWPDNDTAKCNEWKSGFHSHEHALVMFLLGHYLAGTPAPLYFAFPAAQVQALGQAAQPYTFQGHVAQVEDLGALSSDPTRHKVRVSFDQLH